QPMIKETEADGAAVFHSLAEILHTIKSFTAHGINKVEDEGGSLWEKERFDRYVRSDRDLEEKFHYILGNPWNSGVVADGEEYPWIWFAGGGGERLTSATSQEEFSAGRREQHAGRVRYPERM